MFSRSGSPFFYSAAVFFGIGAERIRRDLNTQESNSTDPGQSVPVEERAGD
jgi:hypothetical protein